MLQKIKTTFVCSKCDSQFPKWLGQCPECGSWGTVAEQTIQDRKMVKDLVASAAELIKFDQIRSEEFSRLKTKIEELDQVLGGGIVLGSLVLIGGEPGIGKSTLVLQIAVQLANLTRQPATSPRQPVLYVSGEESAEQIKMRLDRLNFSGQGLQFLGETDIMTICASIEKYKPSLVIIDSIQTMSFAGLPSEAGSVNQVRACTVKLLETAKRNHLPIFIIGHVTKEGIVAGPKTLEHLVDTVLYLEGDVYHQYRLLRTVKNRFGPTSEVGVFEMTDRGLIEVKNPSEIFLSQRDENLAGSVVGAVMEGTRAFLVEVQALVARTTFGYPQRRALGFDLNRLQLLTAVLTRRCGLSLGNSDIHLNVVGGITIEEPAIDLAVCLAVASAYKNKPVDPKMAVIGEVGLGGEIRMISNLETRIKEAEKLGYKKIIIPTGKQNLKSQKVQIVLVRNLIEAIGKIIS